MQFAEVDLTQITIAAFTCVGVVASAYFSFQSRRIAAKVNDAVNNTHPGGKRLYDVVLGNTVHLEELVAWRQSYKNSPWNDGTGVQEWLDEHKEEIAQFRRDIEELKSRPKCPQKSLSKTCPGPTRKTHES